MDYSDWLWIKLVVFFIAAVFYGALRELNLLPGHSEQEAQTGKPVAHRLPK